MDVYKIAGLDMFFRCEPDFPVNVGRIGIGSAVIAFLVRVIALAEHLHDLTDTGLVIVVHNARLNLRNLLCALLGDLGIRIFHFGCACALFGRKRERTDAFKLVFLQEIAQLCKFHLALAGKTGNEARAEHKAGDLMAELCEQLPDIFAVAAPVHFTQDLVVDMLDGNIQIFDDLRLVCQNVDQLLRHFIGIEIMYPDPDQPVDFAEPAQQLRSRPMEDLIKEAEQLASDGVKELIVIAQDTTYYGLDLYGRRMLAELLRRLCRIGGIEWIRLHYAYPTAFPDEVIEVMASEPKICKYLDIPFQHISDAQLSAMQRRHTKADAYALIGRLREAIPDLALRTTLLVGYPGETQADFAELEEFVRDVRFERLGVFAYSEEEGTYSAQKLQDNIPEEVKQQRVERIMALQNVISLENNLRRVGRTERVLIDSRQGDYYVGRTQYDSPEVDQEILIPASEKRLLRGRFYDVRIDSAADYDLYGRAAGK